MPIAHRHRIVIGASLSMLATPCTAQVAKITVGKNVHVTKSLPTQAHGELWISADRKDPKRLLGCSTVTEASTSTNYSAVFLSTDGGVTWEHTLTSRFGTNTGDPVCEFGPDGHAYFVVLGHPIDSTFRAHRYTYLYSSTDGGKTWGVPVQLSRSDRPYLVIDQTGGRYHGRVYINALTIEQALDDGNLHGPKYSGGIHVYRSSDNGKTIMEATPTTHLRASASRSPITGNSVVLSDGTYMFVYSDRDLSTLLEDRMPKKANAQLKVLASHNGGDNFGPARVVSDFYSEYDPFITTALPLIAVDETRGVFRDRLYVAWTDVRNGRSQIMVSHSADKGDTWSSPIVVSDDREFGGGKRGPDDIQPMIAVNRDGVVGIAWHDRRAHPNDIDYTVRFAASLDGGETFSPSVVVSEVPNRPYSGNRIALNTYTMGGGYTMDDDSANVPISVFVSATDFPVTGGDVCNMTASADGTFRVFWADNRTGVPQAWAAPVSVTGTVGMHGGGVQGLTDLTKQIGIQAINTSYDKSTSTVTLDLVATNTTNAPISGPIKVRLLEPKSAIGDPVFLNSENGAQRSGAMFTIPVQGSLAPGKQAQRLQIKVKLEGATPIDQPPSRTGWGSFLSFSACVYGIGTTR
jgi:hypothetical protein